VFVTNEDFRGDFEEGIGTTGIERADWLCRTRAEVEKLHLGSEYRAWLSDDTSTPIDRFTHSPGRYVFADGTVFAESWDDLVQGNLLTAPNFTETMQEPQQGTAWSNTLANGSLASNTEHCERWSSIDPQGDGRLGATSLSDEGWSDFEFASPQPCGTSRHLYCFEQ